MKVLIVDDGRPNIRLVDLLKGTSGEKECEMVSTTIGATSSAHICEGCSLTNPTLFDCARCQHKLGKREFVLHYTAEDYGEPLDPTDREGKKRNKLGELGKHLQKKAWKETQKRHARK